MREIKREVGGGAIYPTLRSRLKPTVTTKAEKQVPKRQVGGGHIHPKIKFGSGASHTSNRKALQLAAG